MSNLADEILESVRTGLIDSTNESIEAFRPKLLYNDYKKGNTVLANIEKELNNCNSFWFSVAFITKSGLIVLKQTLKNLQENGVNGKILTTDYLAFNEPNALRELLKFDNIEVKIYTKENFHTKGYMFKKGERHTFVVGSSNMTQGALKANREWNLKVTSLENGELIRETTAELELMWNDADELSEEWISKYENIYIANKKTRDNQKIVRIKQYTLVPNNMQITATENLAELRKNEEKKALLISATGTGKTYLAAFDVKNYISYSNKPVKILFLVHRKRILQQAEDSFKDVLGESISSGILTGDSSCDIYDVDFLFSTTSLMSKEHIYQQFDKNYFDYIIIDEAHRAGADGYLRFLSYFNPKFLLGMTATPERPDGFDVYQLFDHNIAYEVRLNKAMEEKLLCPFHYFGITELEIDGNVIDDGDFDNIFPFLVSEERVNHILSRIQFYGYSGERVKGLMFCRNIKEADELSKLFNQRGYRTVSINSKNDVDIEESINRLEQDESNSGLDYIFTVDMFNEGIDIPEVNQIVMLRPTQSNIVFVQQLGRGLRKSKDKEYVVVIDFIGNYTKNFLIPIALSGDKTYNKDNIRRYVNEGNRIIPGCSTVNFDEISKERIFESINKTNFTTLNLLKKEYDNLKNKIGEIPTLIDFYENASVDPSIIIQYSKSYYGFLKKVDKEYTYNLTKNEIKMLECVSQNLANGKRPHELLILERLMNYGEFSVQELQEELISRYSFKSKKESIESAISLLKGEFWNSSADKKNYFECEFIESVKSNRLVRCMSYSSCLKRKEFFKHMSQIIELGLRIYDECYQGYYKGSDLVLYKKYSRKDVCRLMNWEKDESSVIYGYKVKNNICPIFVTYRKSESIDEGLKYDDKFISKDIFSWMTRPGVKLNSSDVCKIKDFKESGLGIELFVNKSDDEGSEFYYLGQLEPLKLNQTTTIHKGIKKAIVNIIYKLDQPVRDDIYDYITNK